MPSKELVAQGARKRKVILDFIKSYIAQEGYAPSVDDIAAAVGQAKTTVRNHLRLLEREGRIATSPGHYRSIRVIQ